MDQLPLELLQHILEVFVRDNARQKNSIFPLRQVCRTFDKILAPILLKTVQLDFTRLSRSGALHHCHPHMVPQTLNRRGHLVQALYIDTMVVRDAGMSLSFLVLLAIYIAGGSFPRRLLSPES